MIRLITALLLYAASFTLSGCKPAEQDQAAQTPATDEADRQEVMKPALDENPAIAEEVATEPDEETEAGKEATEPDNEAENAEQEATAEDEEAEPAKAEAKPDA
ncbi:hypothetical protein CKO51_30715 [Rhodopirellula sp. SM50]|nr:hypothetical protein [Rhodopirellula sp. SM50]PAY15641.1 hypothetical protein CKO51_30715 [Rhodopirellula sp. SM50]